MRLRVVLRLLRILVPAAFVPAVAARAQLTLPRVLSDHMVVQRDLPVHVWGMAAPGENVEVSFRGATRSTAAGELGRWSVYLPPGSAGGPFTMTVSGAPMAAGGAPQTASQTIILNDILVGDVWVASGQSNMEFMMHQAATADEDLPHAAIPDIRLLIVNKAASLYPKDDIDTDGWAASTPETAKDFSAVAWYFAREIEQREHVPVGVIDSTWGGTPGEAWTRMTALGADAALAPLFVSWGKMTEGESNALLREANKQRIIDEAKAQGKPAPEFPWVPQLESWGPGMLWNGMIAPLTPFPIRGVLWYQGESNSPLERAPLYGRIFRTLIEDWRQEWGEGDFPFLYVQISSFKSTPAEDWALLREQQLKALELRNTAMAVTIDIGNPDNVHPTDKLDVGLRLARAARVLSYGESIEYSGPLFRQATPEGASIRAWFDHAEGLMAKGGAVSGFEVAGADGKFVPAKARIEGATIVASSPEVALPVFVRYGWANSPDCNLFNGVGLPASPFSSAEN
ncbi:MAG TPA: sialate O-acetylesterase [Terracidiphilus sp.]|jgi:sialate O-acetylesterase|nr:sialate O-acetylesterase [Terracidiphilus sp.]